MAQAVCCKCLSLPYGYQKNLRHNTELLNLIHKQFALRIFVGFTLELVSIM